MSEEVSKKVEALQNIESTLHNFLHQKQSFQVELNEVENALSELSDSNEEVYRILSGIMLKVSKEKTVSELEEKKRLLEMRIDSIEKQEKLLQSKSSELRESIDKSLSDKDKPSN